MFKIKLSQLKITLLVLYAAATLYSFIRLGGYSMNGGPCNAGIILIVVGVSLITCSILTLIAILKILKSFGTGHKSKIAIILSVISLAIWILTNYMYGSDDMKKFLIYFGPNLFMIGFVLFSSYSMNVRTKNV